MIGAILIDLLVIGAVVAFAWAGWQLGAATSTVRFIASIMAFVIAALLRDPVGRVVRAATGGSVDFSRLVAMVLIGVGTYLAMATLVRWWFARRTARRAEDPDLELVADPLDDPRIATVPGGLLGLGWALLFVSMLVLLPADNLFSRGAIQSQVGGVLIRQQTALEWLSAGFPHYTQTLPKGESGAVLVEAKDEPVAMRTRQVEDLEPAREAKDSLREGIDELRTDDGINQLTWNLEVADVAEKHARTLFEEEYLGVKSPSGQRVSDRVLASLGDSSGLYESEVGLLIIWAHSSANALKSIVEDRSASDLVTDERWTEYGVGVVSGGWFNGDVYVVAMIGRRPPESTEEEPGDVASAAETDSRGAEAFADEDGDGLPDSVAIDPSQGDDQKDTDGDGVPDIGDADPLVPDLCIDGVVDASNPECSDVSRP